jgi:hypothetical protein
MSAVLQPAGLPAQRKKPAAMDWPPANGISADPAI